jgi:PAP2 superfamily
MPLTLAAVNLARHPVGARRRLPDAALSATRARTAPSSRRRARPGDTLPRRLAGARCARRASTPRRPRWVVPFLLAVILGDELLTEMVKQLVDRARPALAGVAVGIAVGVAASRVLLDVHWLTDVLAGLALGWACSLSARLPSVWISGRRPTDLANAQPAVARNESGPATQKPAQAGLLFSARLVATL